MRLVPFALSCLLLLNACGGAATTDPVQATSEESDTTVTPMNASTTSPTTTITAPVISAEQLEAAGAVGDITAGEVLFSTPIDGVPHSLACVDCHTLDGTSLRYPTMVGISAVAGDRVSGMSAADYLRQSIVDPYVFKVEGDEWSGASMPYQYSDLLTEAQVDSLVAFLLTQ